MPAHTIYSLICNSYKFSSILTYSIICVNGLTVKWTEMHKLLQDFLRADSFCRKSLFFQAKLYRNGIPTRKYFVFVSWRSWI